MRIGIAYDLKYDFSIDEGRPDDWLEEYKLCVHQAPLDPRRSFQRAAEGCLRRL